MYYFNLDYTIRQIIKEDMRKIREQEILAEYDRAVFAVMIQEDDIEEKSTQYIRLRHRCAELLAELN